MENEWINWQIYQIIVNRYDAPKNTSERLSATLNLPWCGNDLPFLAGVVIKIESLFDEIHVNFL